VASHDLKEPLHVVSLLSIFWKNVLNPNWMIMKEIFGIIKEGVAQAQRLIKDLLEYSRIGKEKSFEIIDIADVLTEVFCSLNTSIEEAGAVITCEPMPKIMANHVEMIQLFQNLIANALSTGAKGHWKYRSRQGMKAICGFFQLKIMV